MESADLERRLDNAGSFIKDVVERRLHMKLTDTNLDDIRKKFHELRLLNEENRLFPGSCGQICCRGLQGTCAAEQDIEKDAFSCQRHRGGVREPEEAIVSTSQLTPASL